MLLLDPPDAPAWARAARIVSYASHRISSALACHARLGSPVTASMLRDLYDPSLPPGIYFKALSVSQALFAPFPPPRPPPPRRLPVEPG